VDKWVSSGEVVEVNAHAKPLTVATKKYDAARSSTYQVRDIYSTMVYRNDNELPIATVANANYFETSVLTGDYDLLQDGRGFIDKGNGWERGENNESGLGGKVVELSAMASPFAAKSIRVRNAFGPTLNFTLPKGRDVIVSAWVKVDSGTATIGADYRHPSGWSGGFPVLVGARERNCSGTVPSLGVSTSWQYIERRIRSSIDITSADWISSPGWCARICVGVPSGSGASGGKIYVTDIRVRPADALMATSYYDSRSRLVCSVDANNKALSYEYDGWDRLKRVYNNAKQVVREFQFKVFGDM
jgi:YD repeat-containing protein